MKKQAGIIGLLLLLSGLTGCEKVTLNATIELTPDTATIASTGSLTLVATIPADEQEERQLYYPLVWWVSNPALGFLQVTEGNTVVYVATGGSGVNTVMVQDQSGAEGIASVEQQ